MPALDLESYVELPLADLSLNLSTDKIARKVKKITTAPKGLEGEGFPVYRAFAQVDLADLDPFVHMDQMGEVNYAPYEPKGTPWHPHRGFETVTYMIDGVFVHNDSNGGGGVISNGDTQWMTAGSGILHIERPPESLVIKGGLFHGIQLWVNLESSKKMVQSKYQDLRADKVGLASNKDKDALFRIIAGDLGEIKGPGTTYSPISMVHATLLPGAHAKLAWKKEYNLLVYALSGSGLLGSGKDLLSAHQLAVWDSGDYFEIFNSELNTNFDVLILGGLPIKEPVVAYGPFVMNNKAQIQQAFQDYRKGLLGTIPD